MDSEIVIYIEFTFEPKLKEMESIAKNLVKEPDTMKKMVSSSSLASSNKGKGC